MENQKQRFHLKDGVSYVNCAYMSPMLRASEEKAIEGLIRKRNPFEVAQEDFFTEVDEVKALFATLVNCQAGQVALFPSTSYGFASVLKNTSATGKKKVIVVENEFPSGYFAAQQWALNHELQLQVIALPSVKNRYEQWNLDLLEAITDETAFVLISSVHWMNGCVFKLEDIGNKCKSLGVKFFVDGTQSVGALPLDVSKIHVDALICATYKWLFGPYSCTIGYISDSFSEGSPIEESWMNRINARDFANLSRYEKNYYPQAGRYNVGETSDFVKIPFLIESLKTILDWNPATIQTYCKELMRPLIDLMAENNVSLEKEDYQSRHLLGFYLAEGRSYDALWQELKREQIYLSVRGNALRVSPNVYNTTEDIDRLIGVLKNHF